MTQISDPNEIHLQRSYDAPLKAVWDAWTDPAQAAQWWGPRGFTLTTHSKDFRAGGSWVYTMHGPDGVDYPNQASYLEVEPLARLVYDHGANDGQPPMFRVTVVFAEVDGKTSMDMRMRLPTPEAAVQTRKFIKLAGGEATWDRLAEYLAEHLSAHSQFVINRSFEAPQELMFDMWTKPDLYARWLAPAGFDMRFIHADIRTGGNAFYCMSAPAFAMYSRAHYELVHRPDLLVFTHQFCDEHENITRHPMAPTWPETMRTTVAFTAESPHQTRVTVTAEVTGPATAEEMALFLSARGGMTQGWTGSFDKLEEILAADSVLSS